MSQALTYRSSKQGWLSISYQRGYDKDLPALSISRCLKHAIAMVYSEIDPNSLKSTSIKPHSVRHVATSLNALKHFSVDDMIASGAWTSFKVFLLHYSQNHTTDELSILHRIG